jgi:Ca2+-binding RTX toxin-like protein
MVAGMLCWCGTATAGNCYNWGGGATIINGTSGNDILTGTNGRDEMHGFEGSDTFYGLAGVDCEEGGQSCTSVATMNGGNDSDFFEGTAMYAYGGDGADQFGGGYPDCPAQYFEGAGKADWAIGNYSFTPVYGATFYGQGNDDFLYGGDAADYLDGGSGSDEIDGYYGTDTCVNGEVLRNCP